MNTPNNDSSAAQSASERQPEGQLFPGSNDTGANGDDNSGSGGTEGGQEISGARVRSGAPNYDAPGNAQDGDVGGNTTSGGSGVSGGETGQVTL